jgi:hydrogenase/urease accessory protein HupE
MPYLKWTRRKLGPPLLMTLAWLFATTGLAAHDPGLSALEVSVSPGRISASLAIAAPDVAVIDSGSDPRVTLSQLARDAVRVSVDGARVPLHVDGVSIDGGAATVRLSFATPDARGHIARLVVESDVPKRIARGHRQLVVVRFEDRLVSERLVGAAEGAVAIDVEIDVPSAAYASWNVLGLGIRHILSGYDHLVFLAGLLLAARGARELVVALTAFTAAHSVSLTLVVLGSVQAPPSIVEPLIAASIAWIGLENLIRPARGARWFVVFGFGLIHGFGFAGALIELGLGSTVSQVVVAVLSFNAGVEIGQLAVVAGVMPLVWMMRSRPHWQGSVVPLCSLLIVFAGGYWLIERLR